MDEQIKIIGDKQMLWQLDKLKEMGARTHNFRGAFTRAAKPLKEAARNNARSFARKIDRKQTTRLTARGEVAKSKRTFGPIWKSIAIMTSKRYRGVFWLGPSRGKRAKFDAWYSYFQEKGTRKGIEGQFFMRKAYDQYKFRTKALITKELYREIYKIAAKKLSV